MTFSLSLSIMIVSESVCDSKDIVLDLFKNDSSLARHIWANGLQDRDSFGLFSVKTKSEQLIDKLN